MALITVPLSFLVLWTTAGFDWATLWTNVPAAGAAVAGEIGWVVGVYVPTLLGFYLLITGEQLGKATSAGRLRLLLGAVAEFGFAALIPALLLLGAYTVSEPGQLGLLFVIIPAVGLLLFLTVQLADSSSSTRRSSSTTPRTRVHERFTGFAPYVRVHVGRRGQSSPRISW